MDLAEKKAALGKLVSWFGGEGIYHWEANGDDGAYPWFRHDLVSTVIETSVTCRFCDILCAALLAKYGPDEDEDEKVIVIEEDVEDMVDEEASHYLWLKLPRSTEDGSTLAVSRWGDSSGPKGVTLAEFETRTTFGSPVTGLFDLHIISSNPLYETSLERMKTWLANCREHTECLTTTLNTAPLPTRLIDLRTLPDAGALASVPSEEASWRERFRDGECRLLEREPGELGQYLALSYCWGASLPYTTTSRNLEQHKSGIKFSQLPRTLQDAVMIFRCLEYDFIWIDCLCILQDDQEDWAREAASMADVYSNASLCLSADRAAHCDEGFLHSREWESWYDVEFEDAEGRFDLYFHCVDNEPTVGDEPPDPDPLLTRPLRYRAWAFQEAALAPRILAFLGWDTLFACSQIDAGEDGHLDLKKQGFIMEAAEHLREPHLYQPGPESDQQHWHDFVSVYTPLLLTHSSDKLPALSGIIDKLQKLTGDTCYAGLWKKHFIENLTWYVASDTCSKPDQWRAPSWSFAAIDGLINYNMPRLDMYERQHCAKLEEVSVTPATENPLGELTSGFARVKGPVTSVCHADAIWEDGVPYLPVDDSSDLQQADGSYVSVILMHDRYMKARAYFDFHLGSDSAFEGDVYVPGRKICEVLMTTPYAGVAIQPVGEGSNEYVRVGVVAICGEADLDSDSLDGHDEKEFRDELLLSLLDYPRPRSIVLL